VISRIDTRWSDYSTTPSPPRVGSTSSTTTPRSRPPFREPYTETPDDDFRRSFEVNAISAIRITYRLLPEMRARGWGRIVQVTSGIQEIPQLMAYAASKAALDKFVRDTVPSLRQSGVLMNLLDPGWLRTDLGGPNAPNAVETVLPGALVPVLIEGEVHGVLFRAQDYAGAS
jgi:NAD(P)-dependent dehydrogenase (short-subunit alcohol dehydrogenase family)